jgi:hypothetical protein
MPGSEQDAAPAGDASAWTPVEHMRHHRGESLSRREERLTPVVGTCKELANVVPSEVSQGDR